MGSLERLTRLYSAVTSGMAGSLRSDAVADREHLVTQPELGFQRLVDLQARPVPALQDEVVLRPLGPAQPVVALLAAAGKHPHPRLEAPGRADQHGHLLRQHR